MKLCVLVERCAGEEPELWIFRRDMLRSLKFGDEAFFYASLTVFSAAVGSFFTRAAFVSGWRRRRRCHWRSYTLRSKGEMGSEHGVHGARGTARHQVGPLVGPHRPPTSTQQEQI